MEYLSVDPPACFCLGFLQCNTRNGNVIQGTDLVSPQTKSGVSADFCGLLQATVIYSLKTCSSWNGEQRNRNLRVKKPCGPLCKLSMREKTGKEPNYHFADDHQNRLINRKEIDPP